MGREELHHSDDPVKKRSLFSSCKNKNCKSNIGPIIDNLRKSQKLVFGSLAESNE